MLNIIQNRLTSNILRNASWLMLERMVGLINGTIIGIIVIRYLGPELNGELAYINSLYIILSFLATLGLNSILVKEFIEKPENIPKNMTSALVLQCSGAVLMLISVCFFIVITTEYNIKVAFYLGLSWVVNRTVLYATYFEAKLKASVYVKVKLVSLSVSLVCKLIAIYLDFSIEGIAISYLVEAAVYSGLIVKAYRKDINVCHIFEVEKGNTMRLFKKTTPLILSAIAAPMFMQMDVIMIESMLTTHDVGVYNAATRLSIPLYFVMGIVVASYYPKLIDLYSTNKNEFEVNIIFLVKASYIISFSILILYSLSSEWLVNTVYGEEFYGVKSVLDIHIYSIIFAFLGPIGSRWILITNNLHHEFYKTLLAAIINLVLNYTLIIEYGLQGAAIASVVSYLVANLLYFSIFSETRTFFFKCILYNRIDGGTRGS